MTIRTFLVSLFISSTVFAQAKVGGSGDTYLEMVPSTRSLGMGGVGAALIDRQSHFSNPATLALAGDHQLSFSFRPFPAKLYDKTDHQSLNLTGQIAHPGQSWNLYAGIQKVGLTSGPWLEHTYQQGTYEGTVSMYDFKANTYALTLAAASTSPISIGFGTTFQYIEEKLSGITVDGFSYDLGAVVRIPLTSHIELPSNSHSPASLTAGVSLKRLGPDIKFVDNKIPLPTAFLFGLALQTHVSDFSLLVAVEEETSQKLANGEGSIGLETGFRDAIWIRVGRDGNRDGDDMTTYGGSLSVRGLVSRIISPTKATEADHGLFRRLDLIASYASSVERSELLLSGVDYFQLELVL